MLIKGPLTPETPVGYFAYRSVKYGVEVEVYKSALITMNHHLPIILAKWVYPNLLDIKNPYPTLPPKQSVNNILNQRDHM